MRNTCSALLLILMAASSDTYVKLEFSLGWKQIQSSTIINLAQFATVADVQKYALERLEQPALVEREWSIYGSPLADKPQIGSHSVPLFALHGTDAHVSQSGPCWPVTWMSGFAKPSGSNTFVSRLLHVSTNL